MGTTFRIRFQKKSKNPKYIIRNSTKIHNYRNEDGSYGTRIVKSRYIGRIENDPYREHTQTSGGGGDTDFRRKYVEVG